MAVVLAAGEIYFRFFHDATDSFGLTLATRRWFARHYVMNNAGVRDNIDYELAATAGRRRITFLGDSFTAGHGVADVENRFANRIRRMRPGWEVHVFARNGWDTGHEMGLVDSVLAGRLTGAYRLDQVVLIYCLNDISDIVSEWQAILKRIYSRRDPGFVFRHSYFLNALYYRIMAATDPDIRSYYRFTRAAYEGPVWEAQQKRLIHLRDAVQRQGGRLLVVTFPFLQALGPHYEYAGVHAQLDRFWRDQGVPNLDLEPVFEGIPARRLTVSAWDAHPNEEAHRMAAEAIVRFLDEQLRSR